MMSLRERLPNRRESETFNLAAGGLSYTCTVSRYSDGRLAELFLSNHKCNSQADMSARDAAIVFSFAVQHGADPELIRRALCPSGPLAAALDQILSSTGGVAA
jgi:hypothetical protein